MKSTTKATGPAPERRLDSFEQSLLIEMRQHVAERGAKAAPGPQRVRRRLTSAAAAVVAGVAVTIAALGLRPDAAYAVADEPNGDVAVTVKSLEDPEGFERALAEHGVQAEVTLGPGMVQDVPAPDGGATADGTAGASAEDESIAPSDDGHDPSCNAIQVSMGDEGVKFHLDADVVDSDSKLYIKMAGVDGEVAAFSVRWDDPQCQ